MDKLLSSFLGFNLTVTNRGATYTARSSIEDKLLPFFPYGWKEVPTPAWASLLQDLEADQSPGLDEDRFEVYRQLIGYLRYISRVRPDIEYALALLSRRVVAPTEIAWSALWRICIYLVGTPNLGICFDGDRQDLFACSDSDYGNTHDGRNTSGIVVFFMGAPIVARSEKQSIAADSTAAAEIIALHSAANRLESLVALLSEMIGPLNRPVPLYCDNHSAVTCCTTPTDRKSRSLNIRIAKVRDLGSRGILKVHQIPSKENLADFFTKVLEPATFLSMRDHIMGGKRPSFTIIPPQKK